MMLPDSRLGTFPRSHREAGSPAVWATSCLACSQGELAMRICEVRRTIVATLVAVFALTGVAEAAIVPVQSLTQPFRVTNSSVTKTPDGVHFGVYADAGRTGGSLLYDGANGTTFGSLNALAYTYNYNTSDNRPVGAV